MKVCVCVWVLGMIIMESIRNIFLVGKKDKSGAIRWITNFSMLISILVALYLNNSTVDFSNNMDSVMQHEQENAVMQHKQENATFNKATCKIDAIGNLIRPNSLLLNDQTFTRYAECL